MTATADISQSIASLTEAHKETMMLIARLRKLEGIGVDAARTELVGLIHQSLKDAENELELLNVKIEDLPAGDYKTTFTSKWHKLSEDNKIARVTYRKAQMEAKKNAEVSRRTERELLLGHGPDGKRHMKNVNQLSQDELLRNASSDITTSLRRTHTLLQSELTRSQFASETLDQSTQALKELSTRYSAVDDMLLKSRRLITDLVRKNKSDAWYYEKAIYIMVFTIVWLIIRRFLYGPFWLFIWLPLKLCWYILSLFGVLLGAGSNPNAGLVTEPPNGGAVVHEVPVEQHIPKVKGVPSDLPTIPASLRSTREPVVVELEEPSAVPVEPKEQVPEQVPGEVPQQVAPKEVVVEEAIFDAKVAPDEPEAHPPPPAAAPPVKEEQPIREQVEQIIDEQKAQTYQAPPVYEQDPDIHVAPSHDEL